MAHMSNRGESLDAVVQQIEQVLATMTTGAPMEEVVDDFLAAFNAVAFSPKVLAELQTVQPFLLLLPRFVAPTLLLLSLILLVIAQTSRAVQRTRS
jgi:hypothetical protein